MRPVQQVSWTRNTSEHRRITHIIHHLVYQTKLDTNQNNGIFKGKFINITKERQNERK